MLGISIIVPVFNAEKFITKCIDSIIAQTYRNYELILIDDGSTDNSALICDKYSSEYEFIKVIHQKNKGVSSARNAGIEASLGKYIMFCDSDDYVEPNWCEKMFNTIEKNQKCGVLCNFWREDIYYKDKTPEVMNDPNLNNERKYSYFEIYKLGLSFSVWGQIFHRDLINELNLRFDVNRPFAEDSLFCIEYMSQYKNFMIIASPLYHYIDNNYSAAHKYYVNKYEYSMPLFTMRMKLIEKKDIAEFCDIYFYIFLDLLKNTMDSRNNMSMINKIKQNQMILNTYEFRKCVECMSGKKETKFYLNLIKKHNYYLLWIFEKLQQIRNKIREKGDN